MLNREDFIKRTVLLLEKKLEKAIPQEEYQTEEEMWDIFKDIVLHWTGQV